MVIGMLYFDNDAKKTLVEKVAAAAKYYQDKYGKAPNRCYVHPSMKTDRAFESVDGVEIYTNRSVLPHHFWVGIHQESEFHGEGLA